MSTVTAAAPPTEEPAVSLWRMPRSRSLLAVCVLAAVGGVAVLSARLYTELLWFGEVGQTDAFWTTLRWRVLATALPALGTACFVLLNLALVERAAARTARERDGLAGLLWRRRRIVKPAVAVACGGLALALRSDDAWQLLPLWTRRSDFGVQDPLFHRDVGYYLFSLPLYREVARWWLETVLVTGVAAAAAYAGAGALRRRAARTHLLLLAALLLLGVAWWLKLERTMFALPHANVAPGATYTDERVRLPVLRLLTAVALVAAAACVAACRRRVPRTAMVVLAAVAVLAAGALSVLPGVVERLRVEPQSLAQERPLVARAIRATRQAYGLDRVTVSTLGPGAGITPADATTVENVALWDRGVLRPALDDLQAIGGYYRFPSVSVGSYEVDGRPAVMSVGARQLAVERVPPEDRSWANTRFAYTHGKGVVAVQGGDAGDGGLPRFAQEGFGSGPNPLGLREPRIYFGEQQTKDPPYVVLNTGRAEVDGPRDGDRGPAYHYDGTGGIPVSGLLRRAAFALRFADLDLLLSETLTPASRMLLHRRAGDRLRTLAPFLQWDQRPQTAVVDGRVQFIYDGYTTSEWYPYSEPVEVAGEDVNYIRAAAHAAVDAFTGEVRIYAAADADPLLRAWQSLYPELIRPASTLPESLRERLRYPRLLFAAQSRVYETYHAENATAFWNGDDAWTPARQLAGPVERVAKARFPRRSGRPMSPAYTLGRLPGDERERFMLTAAYTPRGRENLVGYLAGSVGADGRPELALLSLPRDRLLLGPTQATRRILASAGVVRRIQLLNRESSDLGSAAVSRTTLGMPRIVPLGGTLAFVQPLFLTAGGAGVPRLQLVTVLVGGRTGYGATLAGALRRLEGCSAADGPQRCEQQGELAPLGDQDVDGDDPEHEREAEPRVGAG